MAILDWENFERIHGRPEGARGAFENVCFELIRKENNLSNNVKKIRPHNGDHGIDICVNNIGIEPIKIYQCKYFRDSLGDSQKNQIRHSFSTIVSNEKFEVCSWTLMLPHDMSVEESGWWNIWKDKMNKNVPSIQISCICGQEIIQKLMEYNLYEKYFTVSLPKIEKCVLLKENFEDVIESYIKNYTSVLFLQEKDEPQIELRDLYIEIEYEIFLSDVDSLENANIGLIEYLNLFINYEGKASRNTLPVLFIEGHAGIGKTSFISKLAYEYRNNNVLSGWNLYIIRLRDLISEGGKINFLNPWQDFYHYLNIGSSFSEFMKEMNRSVLILEGFDELSMIDNIQNENKSKYFNKIYSVMSQYQSNCRLIVTSRPDYIVEENDWNKITACKIVIRMKHLSLEKKQEWLDLAKKKNMSVSYTLRKAILTEQKEDIQVIISTPFTLYLIVHNKVDINNSFELWNIYRKIFGKEMVQKSYDRIAHPSEQLAEYIFKITYEIAFFMYENNRLDISWKEIDDILQNLEISDDDVESIKKMGLITNAVLSDAKIELRKLLKNNYALHTYYKRSANGGGLAFIHNYIKDFFICEKISITLTEAYKQLDTNNLNSYDIENLNLTFYKLFSSNFLDNKVIEFLLSNARMELSSNTKNRIWFWRECGTMEQRIFPIVFSDMLINGFCYDNKNIERIDGEVIEKPINEFYNLWILFKKIYALYQNSDDYITLLVNASFKTGNQINFFRILINELLRTDKNFLAEINLSSIDLNNTHLNKAQLYHCDFSKANLYSVDFSDSDIEKSSLKSAKCIKANFRNTSLKDVIAKRAIFNNADMRNGKWENVDLEKAHFIETSLDDSYFTKCQFVNVDFSNANFHKSILNEVVLKNCKLFKTLLKQTELKYVKFRACILRHVNLQDANLECGKFENTIIKDCNFEGADLSRVDLSYQELIDCNLERCILTGTNFTSTKLKKVSLNATDLSNAILCRIEISQSDLTNVKLKNSDLKGIRMSKVKLAYGDLTFSKMSGAIIEKSDMRYAKLYGLKGDGADFNGTNFKDAYLMKALLSDSNMRNCIFLYADMRNVNLQNADLFKADLSGANLEGADLRNANLEGANLKKTILTGANLSNANLKNAKLKDTIFRGAIRKNERTKKTTLLHNTNLAGVHINDITALRQEDLLHMLMQADCSKANFKDVPLDIKKMLE